MRRALRTGLTAAALLGATVWSVSCGEGPTASHGTPSPTTAVPGEPAVAAPVASPAPVAQPSPPPARAIRTRAKSSVRAVLVGTEAACAADALGPLGDDVSEVHPGAALAGSAVLLVAREDVLRRVPAAHVRVFAEDGGVVFVDAWGGDEAWLASLAGEGAVRALGPSDAILSTPHALGTLPPSHHEPRPEIVGVEARGEVRVVATRQDTLSHDCSCERAEGRRRFGENLARHATGVALRSRPSLREDAIRITTTRLDGRAFRAEASVRNDTPGPSVAWLRLLPREGPAVAEASVPVAPGAEATVVLGSIVPVPFDVVEHRLVASREDDVSVDRAVWLLESLVGAPDVALVHAGEFTPGLPATVRVLVRNSLTGEPLPGLPATLRLAGTQGTYGVFVADARGATDAAGTTSVAVAVPDAPAAEAKWEVAVTTPLTEETVASAARACDTVAGHLLLDVPVHRPGSRVKFRLLAVRPATGRPVADRSVEVELRGPDRRVANVGVRTDARGVAAGEIEIPATAAAGDYAIRAGTLASAPLRVERFEVPRFEVALDAVPREIRPGAPLVGAVSARRFDGTPLAGAEVSVAVRTNDLAAPPVARWEGATDDTGRAEFRADVPAGPATNPAEALFLDVSVTDAGGRPVREVRRLARRGAGVLPGATVHQPAGALSPGRPGTVLVRTGLPAESVVDVSVDGAPATRRAVDEFGFVAVDVPSPGPDTRIDVAGTPVHPRLASGPVTLSVARRLVAAGAPVPVRVTTDRATPHVLLDVFHGATLVATHRFRVVDGVAAGDVPLPRDVAGPVDLQAWVPPANGPIVPSAVRVFAVPPERLRMSLVPGAAEVRPGETVGIDVRVTDLEGRGVPAAVALRVVDEAVLSLVERPIDVARVALALDSALADARRDASGWTAGDLAGLAAQRDLTRGESRLAEVLLAQHDNARGYTAIARSLPVRHESHAERVRLQFRAWAESFVARAEAVLAGDLAPAPSPEAPDVAAALVAAAARGAFGRDGLVDPWGTALGLVPPQGLPLDWAARADADAVEEPVEMGAEVRLLALRSPGPDAVWSSGRARDRREPVTLGGTPGVPSTPDDASYEVPLETVVRLHALWVRRHGHTFDEAAYLASRPSVGFGGGAGGAFGRRAGGGGKLLRATPTAEPRMRRFFPDAIEREIAVVAAGTPTWSAASFRAANGRARVSLERPRAAIPGTERLELRLRGGPADEVLDGVAGLLRQPHGCFEQASSAVFPNILALSHLEGTAGLADATRAGFEEAIRKGTDLLLTYEIPGGGFDWFGRPPAKLLLSAYGAHEWWMLHKLRRRTGRDDADGRDGAGAVAVRTTRWLVSQQREDGSFPAEGAPYEWRGSTSADLAATAYVGWAVTQGRRWDPTFEAAIVRARTWVAARVAECDDAYALALAALFLAESGDEAAARVAAARLSERIRRRDGHAWVETGIGSAFHARGTPASVEATALAALAAARIPDADVLPRDEFLEWIVAARAGDGTWRTTHATVLALWAILDAKEDSLPPGTEVGVRTSGTAERRVALGGVEGAVTVDLSDALARPGPVLVEIERSGGGPVAGSLRIPCVVAWPPRGQSSGPVAVTAPFPATARRGESVLVPVTLRNSAAKAVAMPIAVVPLPAGVLADRAALRALPLPPGVERIEADAERVAIYLRSLAPGARIDVRLPLVPRLRGTVAVPPTEARPYYEPDAVCRTAPGTLRVE